MNPKYYGSVNPDLLKVIPADASRIVEFGCGSGAFLNAMREQNTEREFLGFELAEAEAAKARKAGFSVFNGNIENTNIGAELKKKGWVRDNKPDCAVFGDVLEHLVDPWKFLTELRPLLKPGGYLAVCIPNLQHWSVMQDLMKGEFQYQETGIMDRTHLRFFTRTSAVELIDKTGYEILSMRRRKLLNEGAENFLKTASPFIEEEHERLDFLTLQFVFLAKV